MEPGGVLVAGGPAGGGQSDGAGHITDGVVGAHHPHTAEWVAAHRGGAGGCQRSVAVRPPRNSTLSRPQGTLRN